jgi:hypothetical protein
MNKKKQQKPKTSLLIPKREPGKAIKTDYLKNLRPFPPSHPVEDLLGIGHAESSESEQNLDDQIFNYSGDQETKVLDDQNHKKLGDPKLFIPDDQNIKSLGDQINLSGRPEETLLDDQAKKSGRPKNKNLDDLSTKSEIRSTKESANLDDQTTENKNSGVQKNKKNDDWKKYEASRSTDRIGLRPNSEILKKFKIFCAEKDLGLTEFFEISGLKYIELDDQMRGSLGDKSTYDERRMMINWKTKPRIINLYLRYNLFFNPNTKWKARDDEAGAAFNDVDIRILELGIIQAQINKYASDPKGSINSFKFYTHEITNFERLGLDSKTLDIMIEVNRRHWKNTTGKEIDLNFLNETE